MFAGDEEINKVYEVSENLQKMDQARSYELDTLREKLRGTRIAAPTSGYSMLNTDMRRQQPTRVKLKAINIRLKGLPTYLRRSNTKLS